MAPIPDPPVERPEPAAGCYCCGYRGTIRAIGYPLAAVDRVPCPWCRHDDYMRPIEEYRRRRDGNGPEAQVAND